MSEPYRSRSRQTRPAFGVTPGIFVAGLAGAMLAALSFSQVAASIGVAIETFRPLGGSFFSWRSGQQNLALTIFQGKEKAQPDTLIRAGRAGLVYSPLSARSLWLIGQGYSLQNRKNAAHIIMTRAERVTRRDAGVQLWLGDYRLRREEIAPALRHYDLIIRTKPEAGGQVLDRLVAIMTARQGRQYLQPYIRADNPWLVPLLIAAVEKLPRAEPVARLFLERKGKVPAIPELDYTYGRLIYRLVAEGNEDIALNVYPLLPKGSAAALSNISGVTDGELVAGYAPFIWYFPDQAPQGASLVGLDDKGSGIEFFGSAGTVGASAQKLIAPGDASQLQWRVEQRSPNLQSAATWVATCLTGRSKGAIKTSINLLSEAVPLRKPLMMALPEDCDLVRLEMRVAGGIGRDPASLVVGHLALMGDGSSNK